MILKYSQSHEALKNASSEQLKELFHLGDLFESGKIKMVWWETDRTVIAGVVPTGSPVILGTPKDLRTNFFCERREIGCINIGGTGTINVDGTDYELHDQDALYIGRGSELISFSSKSAENPANFYLISYPAHHAYPTKLIKQEDVTPVELGEQGQCNVRKIYKLIEPETVESCQVVMGFTELAEGSVWNTMPPHTHLRRSEVYMYYNVQDDAAVFHFMGEPDETRHIVMRNREAVMSPSWSIHAGAGTKAYNFVWAMGGENQDFTDMDWLDMGELR